MTTQSIECTRVDERLEYSLVAQPQVDAFGQIEQALERAFASRHQDRVNRASADVPDRAQSEPHASFANDRELVARLVHVRWEHVEPELARQIGRAHV